MKKSTKTIIFTSLNKLPKYWDAAATTPVDPRVLEKMLPYFSDIFGNASSNHIYGKQAKRAIEEARKHVAAIKSTNVIFTVHRNGIKLSCKLRDSSLLRSCIYYRPQNSVRPRNSNEVSEKRER